MHLLAYPTGTVLLSGLWSGSDQFVRLHLPDFLPKLLRLAAGASWRLERENIEEPGLAAVVGPHLSVLHSERGAAHVALCPLLLSAGQETSILHARPLLAAIVSPRGWRWAGAPPPASAPMTGEVRP